MLRVHEELAREIPGARMLLQVHDELVFEVPEAQTQKAASLVSGIMERVMELEVPLVVDVGWGKNWAEAH
jgi:DNA polymerase-1